MICENTHMTYITHITYINNSFTYHLWIYKLAQKVFLVWNRKMTVLHVPMVVTYYIKLFSHGGWQGQKYFNAHLILNTKNVMQKPSENVFLEHLGEWVFIFSQGYTWSGGCLQYLLKFLWIMFQTLCNI